MKSNIYSWSIFIGLLLVQLVLTNYINLSQFIFLSLLPALIMCLPLKVSTSAGMLLAFGCGLFVDCFAEGVPGLNALALVPVALIRKPLIGAICGKDLIERHSDYNFRKNGIAKVLVLQLLPLLLFLAIYIIFDCSGTRPGWFVLCKIAASSACDIVLCLLVVKALNPSDRR